MRNKETNRVAFNERSCFSGELSSLKSWGNSKSSMMWTTPLLAKISGVVTCVPLTSMLPPFTCTPRESPSMSITAYASEERGSDFQKW